MVKGVRQKGQMRLKIVRALLLTCLMLASFSNAFSQTPKRNLKEYAFRQEFDVYNTLTPEEANALRTPLRSLIWQWWTQEVKGYFKATFYTREGNAIWCNYFVEPDVNGKWRVVIESKYSVCPYSSKAKCRKYFNSPAVAIFDTVERIEPGYSRFSHSPPRVPGDEKRHPARFVLILKNSTSSVMDEL